MPRPHVQIEAGQTFGRLTTIRELPNNRWGNTVWECRCQCGRIHKAVAAKLHSGNTQSCGCLRKDRARDTIAAIKPRPPKERSASASKAANARWAREKPLREKARIKERQQQQARAQRRYERAKALQPRIAEIQQLRDQGLTWKAIGERRGITKQAVHAFMHYHLSP